MYYEVKNSLFILPEHHEKSTSMTTDKVTFEKTDI